jgi:hypothetical protein
MVYYDNVTNGLVAAAQADIPNATILFRGNNLSDFQDVRSWTSADDSFVGPQLQGTPSFLKFWYTVQTVQDRAIPAGTNRAVIVTAAREYPGAPPIDVVTCTMGGRTLTISGTNDPLLNFEGAPFKPSDPYIFWGDEVDVAAMSADPVPVISSTPGVIGVIYLENVNQTLPVRGSSYAILNDPVNTSNVRTMTFPDNTSQSPGFFPLGIGVGTSSPQDYIFLHSTMNASQSAITWTVDELASINDGSDTAVNGRDHFFGGVADATNLYNLNYDYPGGSSGGAVCCASIQGI